jgi:hypothetical protein
VGNGENCEKSEVSTKTKSLYFEGATTLRLPADEQIRILAGTVSDEGRAVLHAYPLFDTLQR